MYLDDALDITKGSVCMPNPGKKFTSRSGRAGEYRRRPVRSKQTKDGQKEKYYNRARR